MAPPSREPRPVPWPQAPWGASIHCPRSTPSPAMARRWSPPWAQECQAGASRQNRLGFLHRKEEQAEVGEEAEEGRK